MRYSKFAKSMFFVSGISLVMAALAGAILLTLPHNPDETVSGYGALALASWLVGICTFAIADTTNRESISDFEHVFGFDPRPGKEELVADPRETVCREIERRRLAAQELFRQENELSSQKKPVEPKLISSKVKAKKDFWHACEIASRRGFKIPSGINESAINT